MKKSKFFLDYLNMRKINLELWFSSSIISTLGGTNQEPWIQKVNLGFLSSDPTKKKPQY
jgi:hypothetical protein